MMIETQVLKHFPAVGRGERGGGKQNIMGGAAVRETVKKSRGVRVIKGNEA